MASNSIVGLIPAAGFANRLAPIPCSKEIYPVNFYDTEIGNASRPKVIASYLLDSFRKTGITESFMIIREGKWDIPEYFLNGESFGIDLGYLVTEATKGTPYTVDKAYPFIKDRRVVFGFPDILFKPENAFMSLLEKQERTKADLILGLFPTERPGKSDMVELDENNRIQKLVIKPEKTDLKYTWIIAVWSPVFTHFLHEFLLGTSKKSQDREEKKELFMGNVIQAAIASDLKVESVKFENGFYIDIGTVQDLKKLLTYFLFDNGT